MKCCSQCGNQLNEGEKFCTNCGTPIKWECEEEYGEFQKLRSVSKEINKVERRKVFRIFSVCLITFVVFLGICFSEEFIEFFEASESDIEKSLEEDSEIIEAQEFKNDYVEKEETFISDWGEEEKNIEGNSICNLHNGSAVAEQGNWIYYITDMGKYSAKLWKQSNQGERFLLMEKSYIGNLSVVGDWIYYIVYNSDYWVLARVRTDGTLEECSDIYIEPIIDKEGFFINWETKYFIYDEKIYYKYTEKISASLSTTCLRITDLSFNPITEINFDESSFFIFSGVFNDKLQLLVYDDANYCNLVGIDTDTLTQTTTLELGKPDEIFKYHLFYSFIDKDVLYCVTYNSGYMDIFSINLISRETLHYEYVYDVRMDVNVNVPYSFQGILFSSHSSINQHGIWLIDSETYLNNKYIPLSVDEAEALYTTKNFIYYLYAYGSHDYKLCRIDYNGDNWEEFVGEL